MKHYILINRKPVSVSWSEWAVWFENSREERIIKQTNLPGGVKVSTVFLGVDHYFGLNPQHQPVLFETMIFGGKYDQFQERYCTYEEALEGHQQAIEMAFEV